MTASRRPVFVLLTFAALVAGATVPAQRAGDIPSKITVSDPPTSDSRLRTGDCISLTAEADGQGLHLDVEMAAPFADGMYTRVNLWIDCDANELTGLARGQDLWVRAAVGSRFGPNTPRTEAAAVRPPLDLRRTSYAEVREVETAATGDAGKTWLLREGLAPPVIDGRRMRFVVPRDLIRKHGDEYHSRFTFFIRVDTICSEQPILVDHACADEGLPIVVDGNDGDWTGEAVTEDPPDELHPQAAFLDIRSVRVDHDARRLLAAIVVQEPGFADPFGVKDDDVSRRDGLTVRIEPYEPAYEEPRTIFIPAGSAKGKRDDAAWAIEGRTIEVGVVRKAEQGRFRVVLWSDARRYDRVPDTTAVTLRFPP